MSARLAVFDRTIVFLVGLLIFLVGAWAVGLFFDLPVAQRLADLISFPAWFSAPQAWWYDTVIGVVMVVSLLVGGWLIILNLRRRRFGRVRSSATDATGNIDIDVARLVGAVARDVAELPLVETVRPVLTMKRHRRLVAFTIQARAGVDVPALRRVLEEAERDLREALDDIEVETTYLLHLTPPGP